MIIIAPCIGVITRGAPILSIRVHVEAPYEVTSIHKVG